MRTKPPEAKARHYRKHLRELVKAVGEAITYLDRTGQSPLPPELGQRLAALANYLELAHDEAAHFGLGVPLSKLPRRFKVARAPRT